MITEGNTTGGPLLGSTLHAPDGSLPGDRWTGSTLGKYRIVRRLGRGGMGVVYEAIDPVLDRAVAIKVLRDGIASQPASVRKFLREARTAARLNHPHIVHVYEADQEKGMCYLVMELLEGGSAHDRLRKWGPFGWVEATQVLVDATRGLAAVHAAGLIHRDVKPSNIMRAADGSVKLADFGLALSDASPSDSSSPDGQVVGTPLYMSPEQCRGGRIDRRSDVYALGATYYTLLTGLPPFDGPSAMDIMHGHCSVSIPNPRSIDPQIPFACADLIQRSMAKNPDDRPASAEAMIEEFENVLALASNPAIPRLAWASAAEQPGYIPDTVVETPAPPGPHTRLWFVGLCLILMGVAYGAGRWFTRTPQTATPNPTVEKLPDNPAPSEPNKLVELDAGGPVTSLAFDPNDSGILSWSTSSGIAKIHLLGPRTDRQSFNASQKGFRQAIYTPDGRFWVAVLNGRLHFHETGHYDRAFDIVEIDTIQKGDILAVAFHPTKKLMALSFRDDMRTTGGIVFRWFDGRARDLEMRTDANEPPTCLAFSADGSFVVSGRGNNLLQVWRINYTKAADGTTEECAIKDTPTPVGNVVTAVASLDLGRFALARGNEVVMYDPRADGKFPRLASSDRPISVLSRSSKADVLTYSAGARIIAFNWRKQQSLGSFEHNGEEITSLTLSSNGALLAVGTRSGKIFIHPLE